MTYLTYIPKTTNRVKFYPHYNSREYRIENKKWESYFMRVKTTHSGLRLTTIGFSDFSKEAYRGNANRIYPIVIRSDARKDTRGVPPLRLY